MVDETQLARPRSLRLAQTSVSSHAVLDLAWALFVVCVGLVLYVSSLAPTITWGDDATLQLTAVLGRFEASAGSHPAWVGLAHLLSRLPVSEPAYGVNLASAIPAALTLGLLFSTLRALKLTTAAALAGAAALGISHTFWLHAVRAEVYALTLAAEALVIWFAVRWHNTAKPSYLLLTIITAGVGLTVHVLLVLCLPAVGWLLFINRRHLTRRLAWVVMFGGLSSLLPLAVLLMRDAQRLHYDLPALLNWAFFTFEGYGFRNQMLQFGSESTLRDLASWLLYLGYQFVGIGLPLGVWGMISARRRLPAGLVGFFALLYLLPVLFAISYRVGDQFVFFLPSYLAFAVFVAVGGEQVLAWIKGRLGRLSQTSAAGVCLVVLLIIAPVVAYRLTPALMEQSGVQFREGRYVPGERGRYFMLWPPKAGYYDARRYAESALANAPRDAYLLADPILAAPIQYIQTIEGIRPDVEIRYCCWDIEEALTTSSGRPIALADAAESIYPMERLRREYRVEPRGTLFVLTRLAAK